MAKTTIWNDEKLDKLKALWREGIPITKIGIELGVSRNAVAGKAHRLGLPKRSSPISQHENSDLVNEKNNKINLDELPLKLMLRDVEWSRNRCCWPIGDPKLPGFSFCGTSIIPGRPYCEEHSNLAYTNTRES